MKRLTRLLLPLLFSAPALANDAPALEARPAETETHVPVSLSLLPGIGMNGFTSGNVVNNFSLGLLASHAGRIDGVAMSTGLNWVERGTRGALLSAGVNVDGGRTRGAQLAAAANFAVEGLTGWQAASALNVANGGTRGWQASGAVNAATGGMAGWQAAGAVNVATGGMAGWQAAGAVNVATGPMVGLQTAGGLSIAERIKGAQLSVLNIGGDVEGTQIGVINIARKARGLQLGVVNIASELEGAPIGLINVVKNGQLHLQAYSSDLALTNAALKYGSRHVYTLLTAGYQPGAAGSRHWITGLGIGGHIPLDRFYVDIDVVGSSVREGFIDDGANVLGQLRVIGGYSIARHFSVFAGATANVWTLIDDPRWSETGAIQGWKVTSGSTEVRMWPGLVAGIQL